MKRKFRSGISMAMAFLMTTGSMVTVTPLSVKAEEVKTSGTTYYIDAKNGDDSNTGTSQKNAWQTFEHLPELALQAGDQVLLKAGCTWNGEQLEIQGATGTEQQPVVLGKYGDGEDPLINGNGNPWQTDVTAPKEDVAAVHIYNSKNIIVENLEVTNWESDAADLMGESGSGVLYDQSKYLLTGILVENEDAGDLPGVVIRNNYVHDVNGYMSKNGSEGDKKGSGGIIALVTGGNTKSYFTDLTITGNKVEKVCHEAIYMESCWAARTLVGGSGSQQAGASAWVGWPDVYVANNYVNEVAGDGIVLINADGGVAEYNLVTASASEDWNYSRNPAHAAIWMWDCNNVTMQYNEAAYTESTQDGMAFDCDYGNQNVMYQYNYSHDNKGGFWMACPGPYYTVNSVVRYNISVNDGGFDGSRIMRIGEKGSIGHQVYNNTIYWDTGYEVAAVEQGSWGTPPSSGTDIYNNIFCGDSKTMTNNDGINYSSNCVWGTVKDVYPTSEDVSAIIADPKFEDPSAYTSGSFSENKVTLGTANGFTLTSDSPCINAGESFMAVPEETLTAVANELVKTQITLEGKDYKGNAVPYKTGTAATEYNDIGALEYQGEGNGQTEVNADKTYLQALTTLAESYVKTEYTEDSWSEFETGLEKAKSVLVRATSSQNLVDVTATKLELAMQNLKAADSTRPGTAKDDSLAAYNSSDTIDNSGFEKSSSNWGTWQSTVAVSNDQARTGSQSLKIVQTTSGTTAYSEIGNVPVEKNTEYVCEAWIYCGTAEISQVGMEAKHHKNVTGTSDLKLGMVTATADVEENGWKKVSLSFTTGDYDKISISASSNLSVIYLDDVVLYKRNIEDSVALDKLGLEKALELQPQYKESYYAPKAWKNFMDAKLTAKLAYVDAKATQESIDNATNVLSDSYAALIKKTNNYVLAELYKVYVTQKQQNKTDASWSTYQKALTDAKWVLEQEDATQEQVDIARKQLVDAHRNLQDNVMVTKEDQSISYTKSYKKTFGDKAFMLNAKVTTGNGTLRYTSSNQAVATVSSKGKVTIKGTGISTIQIKAAETSSYTEKMVTVTLKVVPSKTVVQSVKPVKGAKATVSWKKDSRVSGYELQYSLKKSFSSGVKTVNMTGASKNTTTIKKLKKGKRYYVRVRAYKQIKENGKSTKLYGAWSSVKQSKTIR